MHYTAYDNDVKILVVDLRYPDTILDGENAFVVLLDAGYELVSTVAIPAYASQGAHHSQQVIYTFVKREVKEGI